MQQLRTEGCERSGVELVQEIADGSNPIDRETQRIGTEGGEGDGSFLVGGHFSADSDRSGRTMSRDDHITDHPDETRMQNIVARAANGVVATDPQRRGDQIIGAQRKEVDPI